jgi:hypothetical protein
VARPGARSRDGCVNPLACLTGFLLGCAEKYGFQTFSSSMNVKGQLSSGYPIFTRSYLVLHRARLHTRCGGYISWPLDAPCAEPALSPRFGLYGCPQAHCRVVGIPGRNFATLGCSAPLDSKPAISHAAKSALSWESLTARGFLRLDRATTESERLQDRYPFHWIRDLCRVGICLSIFEVS